MAWLSGSNPFFKKVKITKTSLQERNLQKQSKINSKTQDQSPLETWRYRSRKVMVQFLHLPVPKSPRRWSSWRCTISQSPVIKPRKGALQCTRPSKKSPFKTREERTRSAGNVLGLLVSMTNGFVCQLVCCFFNWMGDTRQYPKKDSILKKTVSKERQYPKKFPQRKDAWEHFLLDHISILFPDVPTKPPPSVCYRACQREKKNCHENIKEEGRTCLKELKYKKEQLRRWEKRPLTRQKKL